MAMSKKELTLLVSELLTLKKLFDRYKALEKQIKTGMVKLGLIGEENAIEVQAGRVFVTQSDRVTVPPEVADDVLGAEADKIIVIKRSVPNNRLETLVEAGVIDRADFEAMWERAERKAVVNLYVRPLQ